MVLIYNTNRNMKPECGVLTTNADLQIVSVLIYKWGWQVSSTAKNEHITETIKDNEMPTNMSLSAFLILTCLPHPPHTSATCICISAQDQTPNLIIPYINSTGKFLGSSNTQDISCILQKWYTHYCSQKPSIHCEIFLVTETPALYTNFLRNLLP